MQNLGRVFNPGVALDLKVADGGTAGDGCATLLPPQYNLASTNAPSERTREILRTVERKSHRVKKKIINWKFFFKLSSEVPESVSVDARAESVLFKEDPARDLLLEVIVGGAAKQALTVGDLVLAERLLAGQGGRRENGSEQANKEGTHSWKSGT